MGKYRNEYYKWNKILGLEEFDFPSSQFEAVGALIFSMLNSFRVLNYLFHMLINIFMEGNLKDSDNVSRFTVVHGPNTPNYVEKYESKWDYILTSNKL